MQNAPIRYILRLFKARFEAYVRLTKKQEGHVMPSARDVAQFILDELGPMTSMKLQKLVYYAQAWHIVWADDVLFHEPIEAWTNGPVVRDLWNANRHQFRVSNVMAGLGSRLDETQQNTVREVLSFYALHDAQWLSDLTHMEAPWKEAWERGQNTEITPAQMSEYYSSITADEVATTH